MARRIDDVDLDVVVHDCRVLGQDRDTALTLDIAGVHDTLCNLLIGTENVTLLEHCIDQRRLTMVDVGNNRNISQLVIGHHTHSV